MDNNEKKRSSSPMFNSVYKFFYDESKNEKTEPPDIVSIINHLVGMAWTDKDHIVREITCAALVQLSEIQPQQVLKATMTFRKSHSKLNRSQVCALLKLVEDICQGHPGDILPPVLQQVIEFSLDELIRAPQDPVPASAILVALATNHCNSVMECLNLRLTDGDLPNAALVYTLGHLCSVTEFIPFIRPILDKTIKMLPLVKSDDFKCAFAYTLGKISQAIFDHLNSSNDESSDTRETYSIQLTSAFNVFLVHWLNSKDNKVVEASLVACSSVFQLLSSNDLSQSVSPLLVTLLQLYKRAPALPRHCVTSCLAALLSTAPSTSWEAQVEHVICILHPMIWTVSEQDTGNPLSFRNHNEALRCYSVISRHYLNQLDNILLRNLSTSTEQDKLTSLLISAHLLDEGTMIPELPSVLHQLVNDPSIKVKKMIIKLILELAKKDVLKRTDFPLIEFLVNHCSKLTDSSEWKDLQDSCQKAVFTLSTTLPNMESLMKSVLLRMLVSPTAAPSGIPTIIKSLAHLMKIKEENEETDSRNQLVSDKVVMAKIICLLGVPHDFGQGSYLLELLKYYITTDDEEVAKNIQEKIVSLTDFLKFGEWKLEEWSLMILSLVMSLICTKDNEWKIAFVSQLSVQFYACPTDAEAERGLLLVCLGATLCAVQDIIIVQANIDNLLKILKTSNYEFSKMVARAVGVVSRVHLELVLSRLDVLLQSELSKKSSRLLGLIRDTQQEMVIEKTRQRLLLCYVYIMTDAPSDKLVTYIPGLSQFMVSQLTVCKDPAALDACLEAINSTVRAMLKNSGSASNHSEFRNQCLVATLSQIQNSGPLNPGLIRTLGLLFELPPPLSSGEMIATTRTITSRVIENHSEKQLGLNALCSLVEVILNQNRGSVILEEVVNYFLEWVDHADTAHRSSSLRVIHGTLVAFHSNISSHLVENDKFDFSGQMAGRLCTRACETDPSVRLPALCCIQTLLQLVTCFEGRLSPDMDLNATFGMLEQAAHTDLVTLSRVVCAKLLPSQLHNYALSLISSTHDQDSIASEGAAILLTFLIEQKGPELYPLVETLQEKLLFEISTDSGELLIPSILALASHYPSLLIKSLLSESLPYHANIIKTWKELAQRPSLKDTLHHLLRCLNGPLCMEGRHREHIAAHQPLAAVSALSEIFMESEAQSVIRSFFPELMSALLLVLGAYVGAQPPAFAPNNSNAKYIPNRSVMKLVPSFETYKTLKCLLEAIECNQAVTSIVEWKSLMFNDKLDSLLPSITPLVKHVCEHVDGSSVARLLSTLNSANCKTESQKIVVASVRAAFVSCGAVLDPVVLDSVLDSVLDGLGEATPSELVCSYKALTSFAYLDHQQVGRHKSAVLDALIRGVEKYDAEHQAVALEAMRGLSLLLPQLPHNILAATIVPLALTIRPFLEKENTDLCCKGLQLFGQLTTFPISSEREALREQFISSLVCFVLHMNDSQPDLANTYQATLFQCLSLLDDEEVRNSMQQYIAHDLSNNRNVYVELVKQLTLSLVHSIPDSIHTLLMTALDYSKSSNHLIKANSVLFIGLLFSAGNNEESSRIEIATRLLPLLKDNNPSVRANTAQALSLLFIGSNNISEEHDR